MTTIVAEEEKNTEDPPPVAEEQEQRMQNIVAENSTAQGDTVTTAEKESIETPSENVAAVKAPTDPIVSTTEGDIVTAAEKERVETPSENVAAVKSPTEAIVSNETQPQYVAAAAVETQRIVSNETTQNRQASTPVTSTSSSSVAANPSFYQTFDEFFKNFLDSEPSQLDDREIRVFTNNIPHTFIVPVDQYHILYKALFKIKKIQDKAIFNDSLSLIKKLFLNSDFNKFILGFWNCDEISNRELGPIGFSFTDGKHKCDFSDVRPFDDISSKNVKVLESAWSMILDAEATLEYLINEFVENKPMSVYYAIVLRRFSCCGDYKIKFDGKELPIFIYVFRKAHDRAVASGHLLMTTLSCLNTVTWRPRNGSHCSALMKPNYALCETMNYLLQDDENHSKYLQNLERLFNPIDKFRCTIEWNSTDSADFDNPTMFLYHFIKYFNRKNSAAMNDTVFYIIECFKKSLHECGGRISSFDLFEEHLEIDWPFAYCILEFLEFRSVKRYIPESIYKSLPENVAEKYISLNEEEPTREKALTGIFELFLLCRTSRGIPDAFFKSLLSTYGGPKSVIDIVAKCILEAINNLKNSAKIQIDMKFVDFVARICEYSLDTKLFEQFSGLFEMDTDFIHQNLHLIIIGRVIRIPLEEIYYRERRKPIFTEIDPLLQDLFKLFSNKVYKKFGELRTIHKNIWPPWRKGPATTMEDPVSLAINHILNAIEKEAYCIFDCTSGRNDEIIEMLFHLFKERRHYGYRFPRLEEIFRKTYPAYFERFEEIENDRKQQQQNYENNRREHDGGYPRARQSQSDVQPPQRYDQSSRQPPERYDQQSRQPPPPERYSNNSREQDGGSYRHGREQNGSGYGGSYEPRQSSNSQRNDRRFEGGTRNGSQNNY